MRQSYWVDLTFACGGVDVEGGVIVETMPILRKFIGQPLDNLRRWSQVRKIAVVCTHRSEATGGEWCYECWEAQQQL